jgi:hypothetical protein
LSERQSQKIPHQFQNKRAAILRNHIFTDEEWRTLKRLSGLTDHHRTDVEDVVRFLRSKPSLKNHRATKRQEARANIPAVMICPLIEGRVIERED